MIPGFLVAFLFFPGVIVHEMAHLLFCRLLGVEVMKVCYFRMGNPPGYVIHEQPENAWQQMLIGIGPFLVNSILGGLLAGAFIQQAFSNELNWPAIVYTWLGISIAMHAFPSMGDAKTIWHRNWSKSSPILTRIIGAPLAAIIYLGALGSVIWLDVAYAFGLAYLVSKWILPAFGQY
ncbi:MAG: DUF3267 domain-containing protein [bacterium]|jgi:hypothetical protein